MKRRSILVEYINKYKDKYLNSVSKCLLKGLGEEYLS